MDPTPVDNPAPATSATAEPVAEEGLVRHTFASPPQTFASPPETFASPQEALTGPPDTFTSPPPPPPPPETETPAQDVDESNNTTITASNAQALTEAFHASYTQPAPSHELRPQTSYSDTGFTHSYSSHHSNQQQPDYSPQQRFVPTPDPGTPPSYYNGNGNSSGNGYGYGHSQVPAPQPPQPHQQYQHHQSQSLSATASRPSSRPSSRLADSSHERYPPSEAGSRTYQDQNQRNQQPLQESAAKNTSVVIKVGMVGDAQIGKTSLMVKYVEGSWDEDYIQTLGVNFMEKTISIRNTEITFSIWDLGGQREFVNMLPLVCNDAVAILFMFDLTRKSTLNSIKEWYRQGRGFNKTAIPFLVGTKYDHFVNFPREEQEEISNQAKRFAKAMKASLIFSSTSHSINVQKIFKIVLSKAFDLRCTIPEIENAGEPLLLYQSV